MALLIKAHKVKTISDTVYYQYTGRDEVFGEFSISISKLELVDFRLADNDQNRKFLTNILIKIFRYFKDSNYKEFPEEIWFCA